MSINRIHHKQKNYSILSNEAPQSRELRLPGKALLWFLLTKPDGWEVNTSYLINYLPDGERMIKRGLADLEEAGYLFRWAERGDRGKLVWRSEIFECLETAAQWRKENSEIIESAVRFSKGTTVLLETDGVLPSVQKPCMDEPCDGEPCYGNRHDIIKTERPMTDLSNTDKSKKYDREDAIAQISKTSDQEHQGRKNKTDRDASPEFEDWWRGYRSLCRKLSTTTQKVNEGSKLVAIAEWNKLIAKGIEPETIAKGTSLYETEKLRELEISGKAIGVPHGCRFLKNQIFNDEIDRAEPEQPQEASEAESKQKRWDELRSQLQPLVDRGDIEVYIHTDGGHQELRARHFVSGMITIESRLHWLIESYQYELKSKSNNQCPF